MRSEALALRAGVVAAWLAAFAAAAWTVAEPGQAALALLVLAGALIAAGVLWLELSVTSAKELALVATIAGAAAAGRVLFAPVPGVQPLTVTIIATGVALGARAGILAGGIAAIVSDLFLGIGPWTPWYVLAWGGCGAVGALGRPLLRRRLPFAAACFVLSFAFSALMDGWEWFSFYPHTPQALAAVYARGFPFEAAHAVGSLVIALAAGPELRRLLERFGRRVHTEVVWA
jgi:energy-coupling factor transport system substrate-specific component